MGKGIIFTDLDGTLYKDGIPFRGVVESLNTLSNDGYKIYYTTNNTSICSSDYLIKLSDLNFPVDEDKIINPIKVTKKFFQESNYNQIYISASDAVKKELFSDVVYEENHIDPDAIIITFNKEIDYMEMKKICELVNSGVPYFLTHIDLSCPTNLGPIPDCGSIGNLIKSVTRIDHTDHFGKPCEYYAHFMRELIDTENSYVLGDRVYTDGEIGRNLGLKTIIVETGEKNNANNDEYFRFYNSAQDFFLEIIDSY